MKKNLLAMVFGLALTSNAFGDVTTTSLLQQMSDLSSMPNFRNYTTHQFSSYDRTGGNHDWSNFYGTESSSVILAEMDGPGAIVRMWSANADAGGHVRIYIDNSPDPVIDAKYTDFFNGTVFSVTEPISRVVPGSSISYSYMPIPFSSHCKVLLENPTDLYYHVDYIKFQPGTAVRSFTYPLSDDENQALQKAASTWNNPDHGNPQFVGTTQVPPGKNVSIADIGGSGRAKAFSLKVDSTALRNLVLRVYFDSHTNPDLEAPLADLMGNPFSGDGPTSLFTKFDNGVFTFSLPMPFGNEMYMTLENGTKSQVSVDVGIDYQAGDFNPQTTGYLHAQFNEEYTHKNKVHHWLNQSGARGHFVGVIQSYVDPGSGLGFLEGDEQFRVDNEQWQASQVKGTVIGPWNGTGAEDYFNSGYYFFGGVLARPTYGAVVRDDSGKLACYKWHVIDTPTFEDSIDAQMEHGGNNNNLGTYMASLAFWYSSGEAPRQYPIKSAAKLSWPHKCDFLCQIQTGYFFWKLTKIKF